MSQVYERKEREDRDGWYAEDVVRLVSLEEGQRTSVSDAEEQGA